jgi:threonine dehydrogenase-like Zn-dependent dehydrogenase
MYHSCARRTETGLIGRDGALSTQLVFPARAAHRVPSHVDRLDAVLVEPLAVAYRALARGGTTVGGIAIVGAGTIGLACALVARALGATDIALIERDASRRAFAETLGFDARADVGEPRAPLVVEASGSRSGVATAMTMCEDGGTIVALGLTGSASIELDIDSVVVRDLTIKGSLSSPGVWPDVIDLVASGSIQPSSLVSHEIPLEDVAGAFALVRARAPGTRKVVVTPLGVA